MRTYYDGQLPTMNTRLALELADELGHFPTWEEYQERNIKPTAPWVKWFVAAQALGPLVILLLI